MTFEPADSRHSQLRTWCDQLTARIEALDKYIGRALGCKPDLLHRFEQV